LTIKRKRKTTENHKKTTLKQHKIIIVIVQCLLIIVKPISDAVARVITYTAGGMINQTTLMSHAQAETLLVASGSITGTLEKHNCQKHAPTRTHARKHARARKHTHTHARTQTRAYARTHVITRTTGELHINCGYLRKHVDQENDFLS